MEITPVDTAHQGGLETLLEAPEEPERRPPPPPSSSATGDDGELSRDEQLARYYKSLYRPADNPGNLHVGGRLVFLSAGGGEGSLSGRFGGANLDIGHQFNWIGYGASLSAYGGQGFLGNDGATEINGLFGGGPTISLGRLALLRQGYLNLEAGYDFLFGPARATAFAAEQDPTFSPDAIAPHGPRLRIDMGLLVFPTIQRRIRHGVGLSLGYQGLVHDVAGGDLPYTSVLTVGLSYWAG